VEGIKLPCQNQLDLSSRFDTIALAYRLVMDRRTHDDSKFLAIIASRGKTE